MHFLYPVMAAFWLLSSVCTMQAVVSAADIDRAAHPVSQSTAFSKLSVHHAGRCLVMLLM